MNRFSGNRIAQVLTVLVSLGLSIPAYAMPFPFVDEGAKDAGFAAFRSELLRIAESRDPKALRPHIHPNAIASFGGQQGWDMLMRAMTDEPERWAILSDILQKGGKFRMEGGLAGNKQLRAFYAPYTFFAQVDDAFATVVLTGPDVPVYAAPAPNGKIIGRYSDEALALGFSGKADNRTWYEVELPKGGAGFVSADRATTSTGHHVGFVQYKGEWKMHVFVAGD